MVDAGLHYTAGMVGRKDVIGERDSDVVALMKAAGAIVLAVTNVPELCMWWETSNKLYGRTNNPYDTNRTPGGSSGGEVHFHRDPCLHYFGVNMHINK